MSMSTRRPFSTVEEVENDNMHQSNSRGVAYTMAATVFGMFITTRSVPLFLSQLASRIILPITVGSLLVDLFYKWQEHQKKKQIDGESNGFASLMVDTAVAVGSIVSIAVAFLATATVAPIILVASLALKSVWELAMAAKDAYRAFQIPESGAQVTNARKAELYRSSFVHLGQGLVTGLIGVSIGLMAFAGLAAFTYLGLAAAGTGVALEARTKKENSTLGVVTLKNPGRAYDSSTSATYDALGRGHGFDLVNTVVHSDFYAPTASTVVKTEPLFQQKDKRGFTTTPAGDAETDFENAASSTPADYTFTPSMSRRA